MIIDLIKLMPLAIAIVTGFGLLVIMSLEANSVFGQWIMPSELEYAYKQGHLESNATIDEQETNQK